MAYVYNPLLGLGLDQIGNDGAATPGGTDTQVQFNDAGTLAGDAGLVFNKTTDALTIAGPVVHPIGAAATPSLTFTGDTNTGIYSPGADQLAISANGSERLRIDSSGRLGLGTSSPRSLLNIAQNVAGGTIFTVENTSTALSNGAYIGRIQFYGNDSSTDASGVRASIDAAVVDSGGGTDIVFSNSKFLDSTLYERLRIDKEGNVGIGTASPSSLLHLADAGNITVGTTTGTKIGTATTQKLGFYNATPVVQPAAVADATTAIDVITQLNDLLAKLRTLGIIAT
jgi:hypothetical protein